MELDLDNRPYILRSSNLPNDLRSKYVEADKLFLRDRDDESETIIAEIERECRVRGIVVYYPDVLSYFAL